MSAYWVLLPVLLLLSVAGAIGALTEPRSFNANLSPQQHLDREEDVQPDGDGVRRYQCPAGFFRLRRHCYYLSAGTANWREAHFQCTARNATLAVLNRNGKDKILRKYLMGDQFRRLERWISGIYNWRQKNWEWGVSGDKVLYRNFAAEENMVGHNYEHHCVVLDPQQQYKWTPRNCMEHKYYICEAPAGRIGRRRKNIAADPLAPQNQRLRPSRRDEYKHKADQPQQQRRRNNGKLKSMRKKNWHQPHDDNQIWAHGIKFGSRPPKGPRRGSQKRPEGSRHNGHNKQLEEQQQPHVAQVSVRPSGYETFAADGRYLTEERLQSLDHDSHIYKPPRFGRDFTQEEVLLKI